MAKAMKLKQLTFIVPNRVGLLSEVTTFLANGKINIEALCAYGRGEEGVFMIITDNRSFVHSNLNVGELIADKCSISI